MTKTTAQANQHQSSLTAPAATEPNGVPTTMNAVVQRKYGSADTLSAEELAVPEVGEKEVLIEVVAAGIDRGVIHLMTGTPYLIRLAGFGVLKPKNPVLGMDVAGRVVAVGSSAERFAVGDEVMGIAKGSFAEYAVADKDKLAISATIRRSRHAHVTHLLTCRRSFRRNARAERRRKRRRERREKRRRDGGERSALQGGSGANKCRDEDDARARARDARDTHDVRMTVRLRLRAREQASKRDSAATAAARAHG